MIDHDLDARISAWLDGEASEAEARALAELVASDPEVAARVRTLSGVDDLLRGLPTPSPSADLRARLAERIGASGAGDVMPLRRRPLRWAIPAAAALAAGIAIYLGVRTSTPEGVIPRAPVAPDPPIARDERSPPPSEAPTPGAASEPPVEIAEGPGIAPDAVEPEPGPDAVEIEAEDAELALAIDYERLRDFEIIDQLELLEVLAAYEDDRSDGGGRS